jgi:hypothetical protein
LDLEQIEAARERAREMLAQGVPAEENREAALALRRAELGLRIGRKIQTRGQVIRILDDDEDE